jgi:hypothetical protein
VGLFTAGTDHGAADPDAALACRAGQKRHADLDLLRARALEERRQLLDLVEPAARLSHRTRGRDQIRQGHISRLWPKPYIRSGHAGSFPAVPRRSSFQSRGCASRRGTGPGSSVSLTRRDIAPVLVLRAGCHFTGAASALCPTWRAWTDRLPSGGRLPAGPV